MPETPTPPRKQAGTAPDTRRIEEALDILAEIDACRNLPTAAGVLIFLAAAAFAARSFFRLDDLTTWAGLAKLHEVLPSSVSFVHLIVVWAMAFLASMSVLDHFRVGNVAAMADGGLLRHGLGPGDRADLRAALRTRRFRNTRLFEQVIDELGEDVRIRERMASGLVPDRRSG